jgi:hypothetical protein
MFAFLLSYLALVHAQESPPVEIPDEFIAITEQMQFYVPTRIAGRLLSFDTYDAAIWVEWTEVFSSGAWLRVPPEMQFIVYPRDRDMMDFFRRLIPGTVLRMTIQMDEKGKRRVLELEGV